MINSLGKDSHITAYDSSANMKSSVMRKNVSSGSLVNQNSKQNVSFKGVAGARLASTKQTKKLVQAAQKTLGENVSFKNVKKLLAEVIDSKFNPKAEVGDAAKNFSKKNNSVVNDFVRTAKQIVKQEKTDLKKGEFEKAFIKESNIAVATQPALNSKFYKNGTLQKFLSYANDNQAMFSAFYAAVLTCILRPITTLALPSEKKNVDDKKYAAAHSISSGIIGVIYPLIFSNPISNAMTKKLAVNPAAYLKLDAENLNYLEQTANHQFTGKNFDIAKRYIDMIPELALDIPKACVTIALIPVILKNIFGLEKGKKKQPSVPIPTTGQPQVVQSSERKVA